MSEFSRNYGQIIIGYGLLSIGITFVMLFMQTAGAFWLILAVVSIIVSIWIIKRERNEREKFDSNDDDVFQGDNPDSLI